MTGKGLSQLLDMIRKFSEKFGNKELIDVCEKA